jgi:uncharacterized membrane protein YphA (DoxX/SURF4 family)
MDSSSRVLRTIGMVLRILLGAIFVYAAWMKLREPWELFALAINNYGLLPLKAVEMVARTLPWFELAIGVMLILGLGLRISATVTSLMLLLFFTMMVRAFSQGREISCGCFGPAEIISWWTLLRDGTMLAGALLLTWMAFQRPRQRQTV